MNARTSPASAIPCLKLLQPDIRLYGSVSNDMLASFFDQSAALPESSQPVVVELTTTGGDADVGRRIAQQVKALAATLKGDLLICGVSTVYSAGVTIMSAFPRSKRFITPDCALLIHERQITDQLTISGPLSAALKVAKSKVAEIGKGLELEWEGFRDLIKDTDVTTEMLEERVATNWYLDAEGATRLKLVAGMV